MMSAVAYGIVCGDTHRALYAKAREGYRMRMCARRCEGGIAFAPTARVRNRSYCNEKNRTDPRFI